MAPAIDFFSGLPETLTTAILSLVPLKDAVRTSVLALSWRDTWRSITNIEVHQSNFGSAQACILFTRDLVSRYPHATIDRFSFTLTASPPHVDTHAFLRMFVGFALAHDAKALEISHPGPTFELPEFVYEYDNLDHIKLYSCSFDVKKFANITWLKTATLGKMVLKSDALKDLLRECPSLESLSLYQCVEATEFTVASLRLKSLEVEGCVDLLHLTVVAPKLARIKYVGSLIGFGMMIAFEMLEEADFDLRNSPYFDEESGELVQRLLMSCKYAKVLRVCSYITQVLATAPTPWNLPGKLKTKHLTLQSSFQLHEYIGIACLLRSCPSLQKLQFDLGPPTKLYDDDDEYYPGSENDPQTFWVEDMQTPFCVKKRLTEVVINEFRGSDNELRFLKFLFDSGEMLRNVKLKIDKDDEAAWKQLEKDMNRMINGWRRRLVYGDYMKIVVE